ncbi:MAG TPA: hypothetical protein VF753_18800 [Terriglobales bacterium]
MNWTANDPLGEVKPKRTLLPVLVFLFVVSYGLMAMLVVEQGRTIDNQRGLIQVLFSDSQQFSHLKDKLFSKQRAAAQAQAPAKEQAQIPSTEGAPRANAKNSHKAGKAQKPPIHNEYEVTDARRTPWQI